MILLFNTIKEMLDTPIGKGVGLTFLFSLGTAVVTKIRKKYTVLEFLNYWMVSFFIGVLLFLILVYGFELNIYFVLGVNNIVSLFIYSILDEIDKTIKDINIILKEGVKGLIDAGINILKSKFGGTKKNEE